MCSIFSATVVGAAGILAERQSIGTTVYLIIVVISLLIGVGLAMGGAAYLIREIVQPLDDIKVYYTPYCPQTSGKL